MRTSNDHLFENKHLMLMLALYLLCISAGTFSVQAQTRKVMNRPYIDQRRLHYGFMAGIHVQDIEFTNNGFIDENGNQWFTDVPNHDPGFSVGILSELKINENMALRVIPSMHFGEKNTWLHNQTTGEHRIQNMKSTYISVPVDLKFTGERFNNFRPYVMCGVNPMYDLTIKKQRDLLLKPFDCFIEVGLGCDSYLPFFKFIPELKFCFGLANIINKKRTDLTDPSQLVYTQSIDKGKNKMVVLTFYIE